MITCVSCGKANQPTRKFCIRCGASLLKTGAVSEAPASSASVRITTKTDSVETLRTSGDAVSPEKLSVTTGDKWVRPSQVARDRLRIGQRHTEKTELEKAREAFAIADKTDPEQRMLRASELRDLAVSARSASVPEPRVVTEPQLAISEPARTPSTPVGVRPVASEPARTPSTPVGVKPVVPESTRTSLQAVAIKASGPEHTTPSYSDGGTGISVSPPGQSGPTMARLVADTPPEPSLSSRKSEGLAEAPAIHIIPKTAPMGASSSRSLTDYVATGTEQPTPRTPSVGVPYPSVATVSKYSDDSRIREIESDIAHFTDQHRQLEAELERIRSSLDKEMERYSAAAEAKRIRVENLEEDLRRAKAEWSDADKDYRRIRSRRDKEVAEALKRVDEQMKRIKNAEMAKEKRIREIERMRQS
ncbi:MAG: zinc-ribbon domain-containing protein [Candidatus Thorarchaeota archaeon]|nr:zinc-ribbon domain-containing protein [Candidatus Thorarchaeota archaeon]